MPQRDYSIFCEMCGKEFMPTSNNARYCSRDCYEQMQKLQKLRSERNLRAGLTVWQIMRCIKCLKPFLDDGCDKFCSEECETAFYGEPAPMPQPPSSLAKALLGVQTCGRCNRVVDACKCADRGR